jgi:hypothetical protein
LSRRAGVWLASGGVLSPFFVLSVLTVVRRLKPKHTLYNIALFRKNVKYLKHFF